MVAAKGGVDAPPSTDGGSRFDSWCPCSPSITCHNHHTPPPHLPSPTHLFVPCHPLLRYMPNHCPMPHLRVRGPREHPPSLLCLLAPSNPSIPPFVFLIDHPGLSYLPSFVALPLSTLSPTSFAGFCSPKFLPIRAHMSLLLPDQDAVHR
jgi:hypothetical protein